MWEVGGRSYWVTHPCEYRTLADKGPDAKCTPRSVAHQATVHYVFAYALSSIGRNPEAELHLKQGLRIGGTEAGLKFLLLFRGCSSWLCLWRWGLV